MAVYTDQAEAFYSRCDIRSQGVDLVEDGCA